MSVCFRLVRNEVEEESYSRREMEEDLAELKEDYERSNEERAANYDAELAEWRTYEKARVSVHANPDCMFLCERKIVILQLPVLIL